MAAPAVADERLRALYAEAWAPMVRLATLLVGSTAAAEDVVQDAFVAVSDKLDGVDRPTAYLRTAVVNRARAVHRRAEVAGRHAPVAPAPTGEPEIDETWAIVQRLPYRQRAVVVLRFYEDLSEAQIAAALDCRPGTVKSALHRAIATLRKELT